MATGKRTSPKDEIQAKAAAGSAESPEWTQCVEGHRRWEAWVRLGKPAANERITPAQLRECLYQGAQGIFVDKQRTASPRFPEGITVSVLHTGRDYPDELSPDGLIYHHPQTARAGSRDQHEIQATKNA